MTKNVIVVYLKDGEVHTGFFDETSGRAVFDAAATENANAHWYCLTEGVDAERYLPICPELRARVAESQASLQRFKRIDAHFDHEGLPKDREIRRAAHRALNAWHGETLSNALSGR